jgi:hypothetical protein
VDYPCFKLVLVGDGGTGETLDLVAGRVSSHINAACV